MRARARQLIGREDELAAILRLLDDREQLPGTVLLHGEAGIGKTSVWLAALEAARERGYRVLSCRGSEAEARFTYAALSDLLADAVEDVVPLLPPVQRRALEAALLLGDSAAPVDERAVAAASLAALRMLASDAAVCLAVDDLQWLDPASYGALCFALSRLGGDAVATVITVRGPVPPWLERLPSDVRLERLEIGGLSLGALREILAERLGAGFARPTLIRLWESCAGNPFLALELARALQRRGGTLGPGEELPVPGDLDALLAARLDSLGEAALDAVRIVAALADPTAALVEAAVGPQADSGLTEALAAQIVEHDGERVRFTHPLLGSAVSSRQTPGSRRTMHARLARIVPTVEERARHLALGTLEPNGEIAAMLEEAAQSANARGAPSTSAELAEQALRLTPETEQADARRRLFLAADRYHAAGDAGRATALLEQALEAVVDRHERATVLARLARVEASPRRAVKLLREALAGADSDDALQAEIHLGLAALVRFSEGGIELGMEHGTLAVRAAERVDDVVLRCRAVAMYSLVRFNGGKGMPAAELEEAMALERSLVEWPLDGGPTELYAHQLHWSGQFDAARPLLHELLAAVRSRSDPNLEADVRWSLGMLEWRAGNWDEADRQAAVSLELQSQLGRATFDEILGAILAAHRGRVEEAHTRAQRALAWGESEGMDVAEAVISWIVGFLELSSGDAEAALPHLRIARERYAGLGQEPGIHLELGDLLEALVAAGELDEAEALLDEWEPRAALLDRSWSLALLARGRGLLLAARGDPEGAFVSFERALAEHARANDPFQRSRTLLALGKTQRRAKRRGAARATLEDARSRFERLGAPLWVEQTRAELERIGGRSPSRGELSEAERRIAELVAQGRSNKQVAAALFLTVHSVETALTRIYRKLGVRSRAELGRVLSNS